MVVYCLCSNNVSILLNNTNTKTSPNTTDYLTSCVYSAMQFNAWSTSWKGISHHTPVQQMIRECICIIRKVTRTWVCVCMWVKGKNNKLQIVLFVDLHACIHAAWCPPIKYFCRALLCYADLRVKFHAYI